MVLARAGLARLGRLDEVTEFLDPLQMLPAPARGRWRSSVGSNEPATVAVLAELDDPPTRAAVTAERALLAALEAGCSAPVGRSPSSPRASEGCHRDAPAGGRRRPRRLRAACELSADRTQRSTTRTAIGRDSRPSCSPRVRPI